jgi:hypothetical protein
MLITPPSNHAVVVDASGRQLHGHGHLHSYPQNARRREGVSSSEPQVRQLRTSMPRRRTADFVLRAPAAELGGAHQQSIAHPNTSTVKAEAGRWATAFGVLTLATNLCCTVLIGPRAW